MAETGAGDQDQLSQATIQAIVSVVAATVAGTPARGISSLRLPGGPVVGRQVLIEMAEADGGRSRCRLASLDSGLAPEAEVARIEYEREKPGQFGVERIYSVQSVRMRRGELVLLENFLADAAAHVREEDFRPVISEAYARTAVLAAVEEWTRRRGQAKQTGGK